MKPVYKHRWTTPDRSKGQRWGRTCLRCGLQRRIKPGTQTSFEYRREPEPVWFGGPTFCKPKRETS